MKTTKMNNKKILDTEHNTHIELLCSEKIKGCPEDWLDRWESLLVKKKDDYIKFFKVFPANEEEIGDMKTILDAASCFYYLGTEKRNYKDYAGTKKTLIDADLERLRVVVSALVAFIEEKKISATFLAQSTDMIRSAASGLFEKDLVLGGRFDCRCRIWD